jgi:hypothetical protein
MFLPRPRGNPSTFPLSARLPSKHRPSGIYLEVGIAIVLALAVLSIYLQYVPSEKRKIETSVEK